MCYLPDRDLTIVEVLQLAFGEAVNLYVSPPRLARLNHKAGLNLK